ncbi:MAG: competence/damage-inducible protein A [Clostridia bacterium]|nr:competence/damage-inducible protein A [Clostridia bacterium]
MKAEIIAVGSELLLGQIVNSNAQYLSKRLSELGIDVFYHTVVGDNEGRLVEVLNRALERSELVITTGGLGPTMDDLTKETVAKVLGLPMILHQASLEHIRSFFAQRGRIMPESNTKQACFPEGAKILANEVGTAPGAVVEAGGKTVIILPGPPFELKLMFEKAAVPCLTQGHAYQGEVILSRVMRIFGKGESTVEELVKDLLEQQTNPTIAPLAQVGEINLRITAKGKGKAQAEALMSGVLGELEKRLGTIIFGYDDQDLETVVGQKLKELGFTISLAESCTGGLISSRFTDVPGSSAYFQYGVVSYSNSAKEVFLGVKEDTLLTYGAVSEQTAREMAGGIREKMGTTLGLAVTGIAGPDGGTPEKPVGLVYIALASAQEVMVKKFQFGGPRKNIKLLTANAALNLVRLYLLSLESKYSFRRGDN